MAAPLSISTKKERRTLIRFFTEELYVTIKDRTIHRRQPLRVVVIESIAMEGIVSIQVSHLPQTKCESPLSFPPWCISTIELPCVERSPITRCIEVLLTTHSALDTSAVAKS
ncbi:hypothetical protein TNCV_4174641 [Trichonephila clavipes]|nr:hypothetical protein TNCV_4174641 [Trichonephila clavipes]